MGDLEVAILRSGAGRCVACGAPADRVDHFKPRHAGGSDIPENLLPLCDPCNKAKSCLWPGHGYHPMPGYDDLETALAILAEEIAFLEGVYGMSWLLEYVGDDVPVLRAIENCRRYTWPPWYTSLSDALRAEFGSSSLLAA